MVHKILTFLEWSDQIIPYKEMDQLGYAHFIQGLFGGGFRGGFHNASIQVEVNSKLFAVLCHI